MAVVEQVREIIGGDADALLALDRLADQSDGNLTPEAVVEAAKDTTSPLNKHFEWDDTKAAEEHRKSQARQLIASYKLHIVDGGGDRTIRYYTNIVIQDQHVYRKTEEVITVESLREQRRIRILRDLNRLQGELVVWDEFAPAAELLKQAADSLSSAAQ